MDRFLKDFTGFHGTIKLMHLNAETDVIMRPDIVERMKEYLQLGGDKEAMIDCVSNSYTCSAQLCNVLGGWLAELLPSTSKVDEYFEQQLMEFILNRFDPAKADRLFDENDTYQHQIGIDWISELVSHAKWRQLIYNLADQHADCLLICFGIKLCSDADYDKEITSPKVAARQIDVYSRVLCANVAECIRLVRDGRQNTRAMNAALEQLTRIASYSESTYLFTQSLLTAAAHCDENQSILSESLDYLSFELRRRVQNDAARDIHMALERTKFYKKHKGIVTDKTRKHLSRAINAVQSMLNKCALNAADMATLYELYVKSTMRDDLLPITLLRDTIAFTDLMVDALFRPKPATRLEPARREQYLHLLAFSASAYDLQTFLGGQSKIERRLDDVDETKRILLKCADICQGRDNVAQLKNCMPEIFNYLRRRVVAYVFVHWARCCINEHDFNAVHPERDPIHLSILDEITIHHRQLHAKIFEIYKGMMVRRDSQEEQILEQSASLAVALKIQVQGASEQLLIRQKAFIDRCVLLCSQGHSLPVLEWLTEQYEMNHLDTSLMRYFAYEMLAMIGPPYTDAFLELILPIVRNDKIMTQSDTKKGKFAPTRKNPRNEDEEREKALNTFLKNVEDQLNVK